MIQVVNVCGVMVISDAHFLSANATLLICQRRPLAQPHVMSASVIIQQLTAERSKQKEEVSAIEKGKVSAICVTDVYIAY